MAESKALTKGDLFNVTWPAPVRVEIPDLDGHVYVRVLRAGELDALQEASIRFDNDGPRPVFANQRGRLVALCACDEKGVRMFTDDDAAQLSDKPGKIIDLIYDAAQAANGNTKAAIDAAKKPTSPTPESVSTTV